MKEDIGGCYILTKCSSKYKTCPFLCQTEFFVMPFVLYRYQNSPPGGDSTLGRIDILMLLDLLGTNKPEPTVISSNQNTHVSN